MRNPGCLKFCMLIGEIFHPLEVLPARILELHVTLDISKYMPKDLREFAMPYLNETSDPIAGKVRKTEEVENGEGEDNNEDNDNGKSFEIVGGAIFREDKLVDFLGGREARGVNWLLIPGDIGGTRLIVCENPLDEEGKIGLDTLDAKSDIFYEKIFRNCERRNIQSYRNFQGTSS